MKRLRMLFVLLVNHVSLSVLRTICYDMIFSCYTIFQDLLEKLIVKNAFIFVFMLDFRRSLESALLAQAPV